MGAAPEALRIEVAAGLVFRDGLLLIAQRRPGDHLEGMWEFPGGKKHAGESYEECLKRELLEELGIEVAVGDVIESITHEYPEKTVHLEFLSCQWKRNEPQAIGCAGFAWIRRDQLAKYDFPPADARLLEKLRNTPELWSSP